MSWRARRRSYSVSDSMVLEAIEEVSLASDSIQNLLVVKFFL